MIRLHIKNSMIRFFTVILLYSSILDFEESRRELFFLVSAYHHHWLFLRHMKITRLMSRAMTQSCQQLSFISSLIFRNISMDKRFTNSKPYFPLCKLSWSDRVTRTITCFNLAGADRLAWATQKDWDDMIALNTQYGIAGIRGSVWRYFTEAPTELELKTGRHCHHPLKHSLSAKSHSMYHRLTKDERGDHSHFSICRKIAYLR